MKSEGFESPPAAASLAVDAKRLGELLSGVSERTIRTWDAAGYIPEPVRVGGKVLWSVAEVRAWLAAGSPDRVTWAACKAVRPS
ncbi:helix-turn-helix transcriptional regulator [Limnoglobus roseus]|uniref:DNA-binding protein n=1 Tax=Limnoglobus roseus TaxID=2598579 RepID=A0A5C1APQ5_9BACT|nr:helix-turn-helix domain-containing protein [Limnoglobus roseus]QEL18838.1 DNA-binding protein [Limnoglobus roseus]